MSRLSSSCPSRLARWLVLAFLPLASACYEWVFVDCPPPTPSRTAALKPDSTRRVPSGEIAATVVVNGAAVPAQFELWSEDRWVVVPADSNGRLRLAGLAPGSYVLRTRRLGLPIRVDTVTLAADQGLALIQPFYADELLCTPVYVQRRRPWWKIW